MITSHATSDVAFSAGRNSIFAFLQKPFRPQNLGKVVREAHAAATLRRSKVAVETPTEGVAEVLPAAGQRGVERGAGRGDLGFQFLALAGEGGGQRGLDFVGQFANDRFLIFRKRS